MGRMPWWEYVQTVTGHAANAAIALAIGVTGSSVGRWAAGSLPDPTTAARLAREYGRPVLEAFVAAGYLTPEEATERPTRLHSITSYSDDQLLEEVRRRMGAAPRRPADGGDVVLLVDPDGGDPIQVADPGTGSLVRGADPRAGSASRTRARRR